MAFPTNTTILDDFNRADEGPPPSASWVSTGIDRPTPSLSVASNTLADNGTLGGGAWGTQFDSDVEVFCTWTTLPLTNHYGAVWMRAKQIGSLSTTDGYTIWFIQDNALLGAAYQIHRMDDGSLTQLGGSVFDTSGVLSAGVKFGGSAVADVLTGYKNKSGTWSAVITRSDSTYAGVGYIGLQSDNATIRIDDFGGGTVVREVGAAGTFRTDRIRSRRTSW